MAIWQFDLSLVPIGESVPLQGQEGYDARPFGASVVSKAKAWLSEHFGPPNLVLEDWFVYGTMDGNRVDLHVNEDGTAEISARIDARAEATEFLGQICELCVIVAGEPFSVDSWKLLEAEPTAIAIALDRSKAAEFVRNPAQVLEAAAAVHSPSVGRSLSN